MGAYQFRRGVDERHRILQLIAETISAAGLVESTSRPQTAGQRLIDQPAVHQNVHRWIGSLHVHRTQRVFPVLPHCFQSAPSGARSAEAAHQRSGILRIAAHAEGEHHLALLPGWKQKRHLHRRARVQGSAHLPGEPGSGHRIRI